MEFSDKDKNSLLFVILLFTRKIPSCIKEPLQCSIWYCLIETTVHTDFRDKDFTHRVDHYSEEDFSSLRVCADQ